MSYGFEWTEDYFSVQVNEAVTAAAQAQSQQAQAISDGSTAGQFQLWDGTMYVPGSFYAGDGISAAYTATPGKGVVFSVNNAATLRTVLGLGIKAIATGTATVDPASIAANTGGTVDVTITGVATDDTIIFNPPALTAGLLYVGCRAQSANTARIFLFNVTGAPIDEPSGTWRWLWVDSS